MRRRCQSFWPRDFNAWNSLIPFLWRRKSRGNRSRAKQRYWRRHRHDRMELSPAEIDYLADAVAGFSAVPAIKAQTPVLDMLVNKTLKHESLKCCPDCWVAPGQIHVDGCDVERCPTCGHQSIGCDCEKTDDRLPWTGTWPGEAECIAFGWYSYMCPGRGWVSCAADHPGAHPHLNRLYQEATWNPATKAWEKPRREHR